MDVLKFIEYHFLQMLNIFRKVSYTRYFHMNGLIIKNILLK